MRAGTKVRALPAFATGANHIYWLEVDAYLAHHGYPIWSPFRPELFTFWSAFSRQQSRGAAVETAAERLAHQLLAGAAALKVRPSRAKSLGEASCGTRRYRFAAICPNT